MTEEEKDSEQRCALCAGSKCLTQKGVLITYLVPHWWAVVLLIAGLLLAVFHGIGWLWLSLAAWLLPLVLAARAPRPLSSRRGASRGPT